MSSNARMLPDGLAAWVIGLALTVTMLAPQPAHAAQPADEILFQSSDLRIYRTLSRGTAVVVLTNVDAEGNLLSGGDGPCSHPQAAPARPVTGLPGAEGAREGSPTGKGGQAIAPASTTDGGAVKVVVNGDGGATPADQPDVVVTTDGTGGTTVIVNINPARPDKPDIVDVPAWSYPIIAFGGLLGGFHYPEHLYFLGYGPGTSSPSMFGGLGLNAGNRFGLKPASPCDKGFDCMFGPLPGRP